MNYKQTKNGVKTLSPYEKKREEILKKLELWRQMLPLYADYPSLEKERVEAQEFISKLEQELKRMEQEKETTPPIKNFLLEKSLLVQFQAKKASGKKLTKAEQTRKRRIFQSREKALANIQKELAKYYETVTNVNYRFAGMPTIRQGISGWAEEKIWRLLVSLGEPNHLRYQGKNEDDYWAESLITNF